MATQTESPTTLFEQVFDSFRKTAASNIELQQELLRQWGSQWPGFSQPQNNLVERAQKFQKEWAKTVKDLLNKHREVLDEQYQLALESLDEAFQVAQLADPQEFAKRCEALCKKSLKVMRETGELQVKETQEALTQWINLVAKAAS